FGTNKVSVKAGFGEHQQLGVDVQVEVLEQTGQESLSILLVLEFHLPPLNLLLEKRDRIRAGHWSRRLASQSRSEQHGHDTGQSGAGETGLQGARSSFHEVRQNIYSTGSPSD